MIDDPHIRTAGAVADTIRLILFMIAGACAFVGIGSTILKATGNWPVHMENPNGR